MIFSGTADAVSGAAAIFAAGCFAASAAGENAPPDFSASEHVFFLPHVGKDYGGRGSIFGKRLCVVGASHYAPDVEDFQSGNGREIWRMMTRNTVHDYLDPNFRAERRWKSTYTKFVNAFFGRGTTVEERRRFFDSVVFFNYLQRLEGRDGNESHPEYYAEVLHFLAFREIVSATRPDVVVAWGSKVWGELSRRFPEAERSAAFPRRIRAEIDGHAFTLLGVRHPSAAFSRGKHEALFRAQGLSPRLGDSAAENAARE